MQDATTTQKQTRPNSAPASVGIIAVLQDIESVAVTEGAGPKGTPAMMYDAHLTVRLAAPDLAAFIALVDNQGRLALAGTPTVKPAAFIAAP